MNTPNAELFPQLAPEARAALERLPDALEAALPLKTAHRRDLPAAIQKLSMRLTCERGGNTHSYWSSPQLASAYLWYFLPWNLMRLIRLVNGLGLPCPPVDATKRTLLLDAGSGPLTMPLALWLAKPEWRELPLNMACLDISPRALELGRTIFTHMAGKNPAWRIIPIRAGINALAREVRGRPWLISAANALNELGTDRAPLDMRPGAFAEQAARLLRPGGALMCVEPGTRLGGKLVQGLRKESLSLGLVPIRPCPHTRPCPLHDARTWCHFSLGAENAPAWLTQIAREARLTKKELHLSFALLQKPAPQQCGATGEGKSGRLAARVISGSFRTAGSEHPARYACSARGLLLLTRAADLPSGTLVELDWPERPQKDARSGAWML